MRIREDSDRKYENKEVDKHFDNLDSVSGHRSIARDLRATPSDNFLQNEPLLPVGHEERRAGCGRKGLGRILLLFATELRQDTNRKLVELSQISDDERLEIMGPPAVNGVNQVADPQGPTL